MLLLLLLALQPAPAPGNSMPQIGTVAGGNPVTLETRTVKRAGDEVTATLRTTFTKPAKVQGGEWFGTRTKVAVRCAAGTAAVLENRYYADAKFTVVANERLNKAPGYAAAVPGTLQMLALASLCRP
jgi:azurin